MKEQKMKFVIVICLLSVFSFSSFAQTGDPLKSSKVVAKKVKVNGNDVVVCDQSLLDNTITIPLSALTEELQIVKLDDADEALVKQTRATVGEKYILVSGSQQIPYKLFERKTGKFVANIGAFGQGPNEYQHIYDQQLDEANNRIYLIPWQTRKILVYDLKGNALEPIPLCMSAPKGKFNVNTKAETVTVSILPFKDSPAVVWTQTTKGKLIHAIPSGKFVVPDFSNEILTTKFGGVYSLSISTFFELRPDSVYHYESATNKMIPVFTTKFSSSKIPIHFYIELPNHFIGEFAEEKAVTENMSTTQNHRHYLVDKKTLKGSFFKMENDFLGNAPIGYPIGDFDGEYFVKNMDPGDLFDMLEKVLASNKKLTPAQKTKLTKLKDSITDNDNNYILYAKIKK